MLPVGPLRFSTQPGSGSLQAAVTMLGLTMEMGRQPPSLSRATSPSACGVNRVLVAEATQVIRYIIIIMFQ